jgi:hypothetical protein
LIKESEGSAKLAKGELDGYSRYGEIVGVVERERFGFVTFEENASALKAEADCKWSSLKFENAFQPRGHRVILKTKWNALMSEYYSRQIQLNNRESASNVNLNSGISFCPGVLVYFMGVHQNTTSKTIKRLFEMVAPVAYVDYNFGEQQGYCRFKSSYGAQLAVNYFTRLCVVQTSGEDCVGKVDGHRSDAHFRFVVRQQDSFSDAICMYILEGSEEKQYWEKILVASKEKRDYATNSLATDDFVADGNHLVFESDDSDSKTLLGTKTSSTIQSLIKFLDEDDSCPIQEAVKAKQSKKRKRKTQD